MTIFRNIAIFLVLLWLSVSSVFAVEIKKLYSVSVPVSDRSKSEQARAVRQGLGDVLVKISGTSRLLEQASVKEMQKNAARFVVQYGYRTGTIQLYGAAPDSVDGKGSKGVFLDVEYDSSAVKQFLRRNGLPIWSSNRPPVVVWMALDRGRKRTVLGTQSLESVRRLLFDQAARRGLPLVIPEYDETDRMKVGPADIWGLFSRPIMAASVRYDTNIVLAVKVSEQKNKVSLSAILNIEGDQQSLSFQGKSLPAVTQALVQSVTDLIAERYAVTVSGSTGEQVILDVTGVTELEDYAALTDYLHGLISVSHAQLQLLQGDHVRILLGLESNLEALEKNIRIDRRLSPRSKPVEPRKPIPPIMKPVSGDVVDDTVKVSGAAEALGTVKEMEEAGKEAGEMAILEGEDILGTVTSEVESVETLPVIYYQWR